MKAGLGFPAKYEMNKIIQGHVLDALKIVDDESIDCCITSPPYWSLRDYKVPPVIWYNEEGMMEHLSTFSESKRPEVLYPGEWDKWCEHEWGDELPKGGRIKRSQDGDPKQSKIGISESFTDEFKSNFCLHCNAWKGQLGLEPDFNLYIDHLIEIFAEVKRVLKKTGTLFVNLGDSYNNNPSNSGTSNLGNAKAISQVGRQNRMQTNIQPKSLCNIPHRFSIAMTDRLGMILRNTLIWWKPNCMPQSAKDRFTVDYEHVFFFSKSSETQYWTNAKTMNLVDRQPLGIKGIEGEDWEWNEQGKKCSLWQGHDYYFKQLFEPNTEGTLERAQYSWNCDTHLDKRELAGESGMNTRAMSGEFRLEGRNKRCVWRINTVGSPEAHFATFPNDLVQPMIEAGCPEQICKKCGKAREVIVYSENTSRTRKIGEGQDTKVGTKGRAGELQVVSSQLTDCGCNAGWTSGIVLDCFAGTGTTCYVAKEMGRNYIGIDINENYCDMAEKKNAQVMLL